MKIAVVAPSAIPSRRANTIQVMKMSQAFVNLGHTVRLFALPASVETGVNIERQTSAGDASFTNLIHHYGLQTADQQLGEVNSNTGGTIRSEVPFRIDWLRANPRLRRYDFGWQAVNLARRWKADLLYTRLPQAAALASQMGLPTILEIHDLPQSSAGKRLFRLFLSGRGARRLVSITSALASDLERDFDIPRPSSFLVIAPDGVDLSRYTGSGSIGKLSPAEARQRLNLPVERNTFTAGYTGHIYPGRGVEQIIAMAGCLPEINFLISGGEPQDVKRLTGEIAAQGLENIWLTGFIPNAELPLYQAACDVLLMPYQKKVAASSGGDIARYLSPMKVFEYMASGRVILSSDLPVLREVLNPNNAVLLPPENLEAWISALKDISSTGYEAADGIPRRTSLKQSQSGIEKAEQNLGGKLNYISLAEQARHDAGGYTWEARAARILNDIDRSDYPSEPR